MRIQRVSELTTVSLRDRLAPSHARWSGEAAGETGFENLSAVLRRLAHSDHPILCFSPARAKAANRRFATAFPGETTFAVKSAPHTELISSLSKAGMTAFDVASPAEMELVRNVAPSAELNYNNPIKSDSELRRAVETFGVRHTTIDDFVGLDQLKAHVADRAGFVVAVRIAPEDNNALHDFRGKFGTDPETAAQLLKAVAQAGFAPALSFHPGSQCTSPKAYTGLIARCAEIARNADVAIVSLNVGGGFPAPYIGSGASSLSVFLADIRAALTKHFPRGVRFFCEPGRAIAAPSFSLLARVKHRRTNGDVFMNDGIYGGLMELSQIPIRLPVRAWRNARPHKGKLTPMRLFGPTCDPMDVLPDAIDLPENIAVGDWIEFALAGAYCTATSTRFNGFGRHTVVSVEKLD